MHTSIERRNQRFRAALVLAGETLRSWAEKQGVTYGHLRFVMLGERESPRLEREMEELIKRFRIAA